MPPSNARPVRRRSPLSLLACLAAAAGLTACGGSAAHKASATSGSGVTDPSAGQAVSVQHAGPLNVYANDSANNLAPAVRNDPALVYVPNTMSSTVTVISQRTLKVVGQFSTGQLPQHVTPSWDLKTLYVDNDLGNSLTPINPRTAQPGTPIPVEDPYNMYFTPDGHYAIVVAEALLKLDFRDPHTMRLEHSLSVPGCRGVDHMDFSADGRYAFASCEFAGRMIKIDLRTQRVVGTVVLGNGNTAPQDVKLSPDGRVLYSADQISGGRWEINPDTFMVIGFLRTGGGAHGLYPSRDARVMYVSNRQAGTISVVSFATRRVIKTWVIPPPASPDMGGVSADGNTLWLSGRYNSEVYAINTHTGKLRTRISVGNGPHGLCVWPQPGRYSLGHTGIMR